MSNVNEIVENMVAASTRLAAMDPKDAAITKVIDGIQAQAQMVATSKPEVEEESVPDAEFIGQQIKKLYSACMIPANNYRRLANICNELDKAFAVASRPHNAHQLPRLAGIIKQVAGVFAEVDTVQDLDKPLAQIEKAVHGIYGDQSQNSTFYFERRGKGSHANPEK